MKKKVFFTKLYKDKFVRMRRNVEGQRREEIRRTKLLRLEELLSIHVNVMHFSCT